MRSWCKVYYCFAVFSFIFGSTAFPAACQAESVHYRLVKKIILPTSNGHGDLLVYNPETQMISVSMAHAGGAVIDTHNNTIAHIIRDGIENPAGSAWSGHYVYWTSNAKRHGHTDDEIFVVSTKNWRVVDHFHPKGKSPDAIFADDNNRRLYIAMDASNWLDTYSLGEHPRYLGRILLYPEKGSGPDVGTLLPDQSELYMPDDSWEELVNLKTNRIVGKVNTATAVVDTPLSHTKGQVIDRQTGDLWVGTTRGGMLVLDAKTLRIVKRLPSNGGIDEVALDPKYQLIYAFEGNAEGFNVYNAKTLEKIAFVSTGVLSTHSGTVDPVNHEVYAYAGIGHAIYVYKPEYSGKNG